MQLSSLAAHHTALSAEMRGLLPLLALLLPSTEPRGAGLTAAGGVVTARWKWDWGSVKPFNYGNNGSGMDSVAEVRRKARYSMLFTDGGE